MSAENAKVFDTVIFEGPPIMSQKLWPRHCVQNTWGAELHCDLKVRESNLPEHGAQNRFSTMPNSNFPLFVEGSNSGTRGVARP